MDVNNLQRLQREQEKAAAKCKEKITEWEKYKKDYEKLHERVKTLPDKVTHDMMIPLGPLAIVPGQLVHTNEITVLLGDNWFAERSAKQASEIIERKIRQCETTLAKLREEGENVKNWLGYTREMAENASELVDICEEYDEEKEALWRKHHEKNVQKYRKQLAEERQNELNRSLSTQHERLPHTSSQANYLMPSTSSSGGSGDAGINYNRGRRVSWQDQTVNVDNQDDDESEDEDQNCSLIINFNHSDTSNNPSNSERLSETSDIIQSPGDFYVKFAHLLQKTPKSILKRKTSISTEMTQTHLPPVESEETKTKKFPTYTVSNVIQENIIERTPVESSTFQSSTTGRTTSRFKAQREQAQRKI